jgi:hypothetical protein
LLSRTALLAMLNIRKDELLFVAAAAVCVARHNDVGVVALIHVLRHTPRAAGVLVPDGTDLSLRGAWVHCMRACHASPVETH